MGCSKSNSKREIYSNTILPEKHRKDNLTLHLKQLEKEEQHPKKKKTKLVEEKKS